MYEKLKEELCRQYARVLSSKIDFGNNGIVSIFDAATKCYAVKAKNVRSDVLTHQNIIILNENAEVIEGDKQQFDRRFYTHLVIYKRYSAVRCVVQLNSAWCGIWSQYGATIPPLSAFHAEYFFGEIPCTKPIEDISSDEEDIYIRAGKLVLEAHNNKAAGHVQAAIIKHFGAITWGNTPEDAVDNALALEEIAYRAGQARLIGGVRYDYLPYKVGKEIYFEDGLNSDKHISFS